MIKVEHRLSRFPVYHHYFTEDKSAVSPKEPETSSNAPVQRPPTVARTTQLGQLGEGRTRGFRDDNCLLCHTSHPPTSGQSVHTYARIMQAHPRSRGRARTDTCRWRKPCTCRPHCQERSEKRKQTCMKKKEKKGGRKRTNPTSSLSLDFPAPARDNNNRQQTNKTTQIDASLSHPSPLNPLTTWKSGLQPPPATAGTWRPCPNPSTRPPPKAMHWLFTRVRFRIFDKCCNDDGVSSLLY